MASKENIYSSIQNLYNMDKTTWQEVLAEFYNLIYDTQSKFEQVEAKFTLLLGEEITKQLKEMYENGLLGNLVVDLSNYYDKSEIDSALNNYYNKSEIDSMINNIGSGGSGGSGTVDLSNYYSKSEIDNRLNNYSLSTHTHSYNDLTDLPTISGGGSGGSTTIDLSNYYTKSEINTNHYTKTEISNQLNNYSPKTHTHRFSEILDAPTIGSDGSITINAVQEYTLDFQDEINSAIATGRYEQSGYTAHKKQNMYMKFALTQATQKLHQHGGGTLLFTKLYTYDGGVAAWEIDNVNNITFRGVGEAGFIKPDPAEVEGAGTSTGKQHFGYIRHCNNLRFINMSFIGRQTDMPQLYTADYGIEIHSGDGIYFEECTFKNMNDACLVVGNETVNETDGLDHTKNVHVNKCKFLNTWQTSTTQNGVYNYWFTNNYVAGGSTKFAQRKPNGDHIYILNNVYIAHENFIGNIIELCNYDNVLIDGNIIKGNGKTSCAFSNYYNTHADDNYYQTHKNITFTNNKIYGCKTGMYINHGITNYPAGRYLIQGNTFEGVLSTKNINIAGYFDNIEIKDNQFLNSPVIGISIGANASHVIKKLDIINNTFTGMTKESISIFQTVNVLRLLNNYIVQGGANHMIKLGDGNVNPTIPYFEIRGNYLENNQGQAILYNQASTIARFIVKDNSMIGTGAGLYNINPNTMILTGNFIKTNNATVSFLANATGTVYTSANVLSKAINFATMTETKL